MASQGPNSQPAGGFQLIALEALKLLENYVPSSRYECPNEQLDIKYDYIELCQRYAELERSGIAYAD